MEQARVLIAIVLSFLVLLIWNFYFSPVPPPPAPPNPAETASQPESPAALETTAEKNVPPAEIAAAAPTLQPASDDPTLSREVTIETPLYRAILSEQGGGVFRRFILKNYKEKMGAGASPKELINPELAAGIFQMGFSSQSLPNLERTRFQANLQSDRVEVAQEPATVGFTWTSPQGVKVTREFDFNPNSYLIDMRVIIENPAGQPITDSLWVSMRKVFPDDNRAYGFSGPSAFLNGELEQVKIKKIDETEPLSGNMQWMALQDRYFITSLIPKTDNDGTLKISLDQSNIVESRFTLPSQQFGTGTPTREFQLYMGPKSMKLLKSFDNGLDKAINFGMFDIIAKPLLWLMNFIHDNLVANYGVAIIILTIITKIIFWPLGNKSYKSMNEMKKLQPLIAEIREKHKGDKQRQNQETMALYKTYKVNPMGGCLPMLVQIPVFFALYRMLYEAIELRHAPFLGWINDLSAPDRLGDFGFSIPFMEPPYGIPVLTLVMGASMFLQQKMSPPVGDPTQAKMMMFMPIVFTFIFINFSSGLVLYWLVNNLISIGQQYYTQKKHA